MPMKPGSGSARRLEAARRQLLSIYLQHSYELSSRPPGGSITPRRLYTSPVLYKSPQRPLLRPLQRNAKVQRSRNVSQETKKWVGDSFKGAARLTAYFWSMTILAYVAWEGWKHDEQERQTPTPPDWSFWTRYYMREAKMAQTPSQAKGLEIPRWIDVAKGIRSTVERLEDPNLDGRLIKSALGESEGDILVEGVGRAGLDITDCPEQWRRGYFDALMTAGMTAEHVEGFVIDKTRNDEVFPPQVVLGPSNPSPMPMPPNSKKEAPREENCRPFFDLPHKYYMRIMTTSGFTRDQKLQAALAYGDWLDFKGLPSSARDMFDWAMDIADAAYVERGEPAPYNRQTGTLRSGNSFISSNTLTAITATAEHLAKAGDTKTALPAFLTSLRVMRQLQPADQTVSPLQSSRSEPPSPPTSAEPPTSSSSAFSWLTSLISEVPYPPPPPSGDLPASRNPSTPCSEAAVLAHIGEILYVSSPSSLPRALLARQPSSSSKRNAVQATSSEAAGLAWTKQAVDLADFSLRALAGRASEDPLLVSGMQDQQSETAAQTRRSDADTIASARKAERETASRLCAQCLDVAVGNWQRMVGRLAEQERAVQVQRARRRRVAGPERSETEPGGAKQQHGGGGGGWFSWLGGATASSPAADDGEVGQWMEEARLVEERKFAVRNLLREEKLPVNF